MTPYIHKQVQRHGTIVVSRLSDLVQTLSSELAKVQANGARLENSSFTTS